MNNTMLINRALAADYTELGGAFSQERLALAGQMTLLGMVMIFAVLSILWAILAIFQRVMAGNAEKPAEEPKKATAPAPVVASPAPVSNDDEVIAAVIAAAVAAYMSDESNTEAAYNGGFRVVSFRRVQGGKAWNSKH